MADCWNDFCILTDCDGVRHGDATGDSWRQREGESYCPFCKRYHAEGDPRHKVQAILQHRVLYIEREGGAMRCHACGYLSGSLFLPDYPLIGHDRELFARMAFDHATYCKEREVF